MFNALTLYFINDDEWEPRVCPVVMPDGTVYELNTWAPFLVGNEIYDEFRAYPIGLRTLIARCMAHDAEDRPSLEELLNIINYSIAQGDAEAYEARMNWELEKANDPTIQKPPVDIKRPPAAEDDDLLIRFFQEYFREPPVREDPYVDLWNDDDGWGE
ncbi:hypothetical protein F5Y13DRAFT_158765 [Hypoxylon sp. FL1857]|nr:hypothetical protein F5Y13DRAFT_158765 [Hypoxylon sp. FL1857]